MAIEKAGLRLVTLIVFVGFWVCAIMAAAPEGIPIAYVLDHQSGFSKAFPSSMVVDREGRYWVSSELGGLFVGDGIRFLPVSLPPELAGRSICSVAADPSGRLWVLSSGGLAILEKGGWRVEPGIRQYEPLRAARTDGVFLHSSGTPAIMASGRAFTIAGDGKPLPLTLPGDDAQGEAGLTWAEHRLVINRGGRFWQEQDDDWTPLPTISFSPGEQQRGPVGSDGAGHLYLLTGMHLYHLAPGAETWRALPDLRPDNNHRISFLRDGRVWIPQKGQILRAFQGTITRQPIPQDISLPGSKVLCLDREGNVWISNGTLARMPARGTVRIHSGPGYPPADLTWGILRDTLGRLWVAGEAGLFRRDDSGWQAVPGVPKARSMQLGPDGRLYICNQDRLFKVELQTLKGEQVPIPMLAAEIAVRRGPVIQGRKLWVIDALGRLILGTWGRGGWTWTWDPLPETVAKAIVDLMKDDLGRPWAIFLDQTYCRIGEKWERLPPLTGSRGGGPMGVSFRTMTEGLVAQYDPPTVLSLRRNASGWTAAPLIGPDKFQNIGVLYSIGQDPQGTIWIGSDQGVIRVEPGDPARYQQFDSDQGLPASDTNQGALLVEGSERVWVGTTRGLAEIRTREMGAIPPLTVPSLLEVHRGEWVAQGPDDVLDIQYGRGPISWELGFPGPAQGHNGRFEFRKAAGGPWTVLSGAALQFPVIPPGHHAYEIRVMTAQGIPGPSRRIDIYVHPPWYRKPLAYLLWAAIAAGLAALGIRWRFTALRRRNRKLNQKVLGATKQLRQYQQNLERLVQERTSKLVKTADALQESETRYRSLFDNAKDGIALAEAEDGRLIDCNIALCQMVGRDKSELIGKPQSILHPAPAIPGSGNTFQRHLDSESEQPLEDRLQTKDGRSITVEIRAARIHMNERDYLLGIFRDITERKQAEDRMREALKEKEVLLQEIHHRVKNNLQVISGLLTLQADQVASKSVDEIFRENQGRIRSMALVHEKLYHSQKLSEIAFDDYVRTLVDNLLASYAIKNSRIAVSFSLEPVLFTIEKAIPLGLIVNELVTNAIKHAFPGDRRGEIRISLQKSREVKFFAPADENRSPACELTVSDNGIGLPENFVLKERNSLGMSLISMLVQQLHAGISIGSAKGSEFRIIIPLEQKRMKE